MREQKYVDHVAQREQEEYKPIVSGGVFGAEYLNGNRHIEREISSLKEEEEKGPNCKTGNSEFKGVRVGVYDTCQAECQAGERLHQSKAISHRSPEYPSN